MDRTREEAFQLLADDLVKEGLLRLVALVVGHLDPVRDRVGVRTTVGDTLATVTPTVLNFSGYPVSPKVCGSTAAEHAIHRVSRLALKALNYMRVRIEGDDDRSMA